MSARTRISTIPRSLPNIMVTGTPGTGKSTLCKRLSEVTGFTWLEVSRIAKENDYLEKYEEGFICPVLDEERLLNLMEDKMTAGGAIVDYHSCGFFPERWFDMVFVLKTDNTTLYDRLAARGYTGKKMEHNIDSEIFRLILDEAHEFYADEIVHELINTTHQQLEDNIGKICLCITKWKEANSIDKN